MIDIHCHILPGIDDGAADLAQSLEMARLAVSGGTQVVVATPHTGFPPVSTADLDLRVARLNSALAVEGIPLKVLRGGDNFYNLPPADLVAHSINGTRYTLIEYPHTHLPVNAGELLFSMLTYGLTPIITHPERNPAIIENPQLVIDLVAQGALVQITAESLTGGFGAASFSCGKYLLKQGVVHFIASDGHSPTWRPPSLTAGVERARRLVGEETVQRLVFNNPHAVISGQPLD